MPTVKPGLALDKALTSDINDTSIVSLQARPFLLFFRMGDSEHFSYSHAGVSRSSHHSSSRHKQRDDHN